MGRPKLLERKVHIGGRVAPHIVKVIKIVAAQDRRTDSQMIEILLEESPRVKAQLKKLKSRAKVRDAGRQSTLSPPAK